MDDGGQSAQGPKHGVVLFVALLIIVRAQQKEGQFSELGDHVDVQSTPKEHIHASVGHLSGNGHPGSEQRRRRRAVNVFQSAGHDAWMYV
jgi:hypothetical protein